MFKKVLFSILILGLLVLGFYYFGNKSKDESVMYGEDVVEIDSAIEENLETYEDVVVEYNPEFEKVISFQDEVIEPRCPYYRPDGISYKNCLGDFIGESLVKKGLTEESPEYKSYFDFCEKYALTQGEKGFGANTVSFAMCLIYKLD